MTKKKHWSLLIICFSVGLLFLPGQGKAQSLNTTLLGTYDISGSSAKDIFVDGNYAYVGYEYDGLRILDVSNPAEPIQLGSFSDMNGAELKDIAANGIYVYLAESSGFRILDASDPANLVTIYYESRTGLKDITIKNNYLFVAGYQIEIYDISDPANPVFINSYDNGTQYYDIDVVNHCAFTVYRVNSNYKLDITDVSDSSLTSDTPFNIWNTSILQVSKDLCVASDYMYVPDDNSLIRIFDITTPPETYEESGFYSANSAIDIEVEHGFANVAEENNGLSIYNIEDTENVNRVGYYSDIYAQEVNTYYNLIYVVGDKLSIIRNDLLKFLPNFTGYPTAGDLPLTVQFQDSSISLGPVNITSWEWDFDNDGIIDSDLQSPTHTYTRVDTYSVKLIIDNGMLSDTLVKSDYITVLPNSPPTRFRLINPATDSVFPVDSTITLQWNTSTDADSDSVAYLVDITDQSNFLYRTTIDTATAMQINQDALSLPVDTTLYWNVFATDGWDTTAANNGPFSFMFSTTVGLDREENHLPSNFSLKQNYPNPFNPSTTIKYGLPKAADVQLLVYDITGQRITTLVNECKAPGWYHLEWDGIDNAGHQVSNGVYFYRIRAEEYSEVRKMIFLK